MVLPNANAVAIMAGLVIPHRQRIIMRGNYEETKQR